MPRQAQPSADVLIGNEGEADPHLDEWRTRWAAVVLADQAMPHEEIAAILATNDRRLVHAYLEVHAERLEERLEVQRRALRVLERLLTERAIGASLRSERARR